MELGSVASAFADPSDSPPRRRRWWVATIVALVMFGVWFLWGDDEAQVRLEAKSSVEAGTLSIQVDGDRVYSRELTAPQQRKGFLKKVLPGQNHETFEAWLEVPTGKREIMAQVEPLGYRDTIVVDLEPGDTRTLRLVVGRTFGTPLSLEID